MNPHTAAQSDRASDDQTHSSEAELALARCVDRLELLIDRETQALKTRVPIDFDDLNRRKTHALWEFSMMSRAMPAGDSSIIADRLGGLRSKLSENAGQLDLHLRAMVEISGIMIRNIRMEESDGTYSGRPASLR